MPTHKTRIVPKPEGDAEVWRFEVFPGVRGDGDLTYLCGSCSAVLIENIFPGQIEVDGVFLCTKCGSYSRSNEGE
jgi:DNA-directed RNA polymerase subunit RPC12/RpoP